MSLSDDGFDDGFDDDLLSQIPLDATAYQPQRPALLPAARPPAVKKSTFSFGGSKPPPAKKPRLYSAPPVPPSSSQPPDFDIVVDKNGQYGIDVRHPSPQEDEIVDQRAALPPPTQKQPPRRLSTVPPQAQTSQLQQQLAKALADLAEKHEELENAQTTATEAIRDKQTKEGEAGNLRRMMERNEKMAEEIKRSHADALAALKAELEEERKARRIDGERLATESVFREQETVSAKTRRRPVNGTQRLNARTPVPRASQGVTLLSPSPKKPALGLKNFRNSFDADVTPGRAALATPKSRSKGKQRAVDSSSTGDELGTDSIDWNAIDLNGDLGEAIEEATPAEPYDWSKQLLRLLFSHRVFTPSNDQLDFVAVLPLLLQAHLPDATPTNDLKNYNALCSGLISLIGRAVDGDIDPSGLDLFVGISSYLVALIDALLRLMQTSLLISALSLFGALSSSVPAFVSASLGTPLPVPYPASFLLPIASVLSDVFAHSAPLIEAGDNAEATQLHEVALFALDSLIWEPSEIDLEGLESLLREPTLFSRITDPRAPLPNITAAVRVLTQLAGHKSLFRVLLNCPMLEKADAAEGRLAFVERLAALLAIDRDEGEEDLDLVRLHLATLDLILLLALSHEDAIVLLTKSASLLTRLVVRIYKDAALIHEHDGARFDDAPAYRTAIVVRSTAALRILHFLACSSSTVLDLCQTFDRQAFVVGARGMFSVGVGRMAYAVPPDWLPKEEAKALEDVTEAAGEILEKELTMEELDAMYNLWSEEAPDDEGEATQDEDEEAMVVDED